MSAGFLLSIPGKINTLTANLATLMGNYTAVRAALIDVAISSRAPSATALTNATWTDARAAALDDVAACVAYLQAAALVPTNNPPTTLPAPGVISMSGFPAYAGLEQVVHTFGSSGYFTGVNLTGRGVVNFLSCQLSSNSGMTAGGTLGGRLTIDGTVVFNITNIIPYTSVNSGWVAIGLVGPSGVPVLEPMPFYSSFIWEIYSNQAAGTLSTNYRHRLTP
jgi:hypothetical protein